MSSSRSAGITPKLLLLPTALGVGVCIYGFIIWTIYLSFTPSTLLPVYDLVGINAYRRLWATLNWRIAISNLFAFAILYLVLCTLIGLLLAIFIDRRIRAENLFRTIFLYPLALSFIVTGTIWKWMFNPGLGIQEAVRSLGWESFRFDWIIDPNLALFTILIAAIWQASGFVMAIFLAALRGTDTDIVRAAEIEGASTARIYFSVVIPQLWPAFATVFVILLNNAIKLYDLVVVMTNAGPAGRTHLPATFMYTYTYTRSQLALGSASAVTMLLMVSALVIPYLYYEVRRMRR